jgi:hypothetical protein
MLWTRLPVASACWLLVPSFPFGGLIPPTNILFPLHIPVTSMPKVKNAPFAWGMSIPVCWPFIRSPLQPLVSTFASHSTFLPKWKWLRKYPYIHNKMPFSFMNGFSCKTSWDGHTNKQNLS